MILVIDGYNVIKQAMLKSEISEKERDTFTRQLGRYGKIKGHSIELVFDGGFSDYFTKENLYGVVVVYSGHRESADDYIKRYLNAHKSADILLVSTDRDICRYASGINIEQIDSRDFYDIMCACLHKMDKQVAIGTGAGKPHDFSSSSHFVKNKCDVSELNIDRQTGKAIKTTKLENKELDALMQEGSKIVQKKLEDIEIKDYFPGIKKNKLKKKETKKLKKIKKL